MTVLIILADFYEDIAQRLVLGATQGLDEQGCSYEIIRVPGALEIPPAIAMALKTRRYDGYIALGCVIRGETTHYEQVCNETSRGLMELATRRRLALGQGVLTVENEEQAYARTEPDSANNKGRGAAQACLRLLELRQYFAPPRREEAA